MTQKWWLLSLFVSFVFGQNNFRVSGPLSAGGNAAVCLGLGLCDRDKGCCNGHGTCTVTGSGAPYSASCSCDTISCPAGGTQSYSGSTCATINNAACCGSSLENNFLLDGTCNQRTGDVQTGATGRLFTRIGGAANANYADGLGTAQTGYSNSVASTVSTLTTGNVTASVMTMLGYYMFQFLREDVAQPIFDTTYYTLNLTGTPHNYYYLKADTNTGIAWGGTNEPKMFSQGGTHWVDAGPLYQHATRVSGGGITTAKIDYSASVSYYQNLNYPEGFVVVLSMFGEFHNLMVTMNENYWCDQSGIGTWSRSNCANYATRGGTDQAYTDFVYSQARAATIRHVQHQAQTQALRFLGGNTDSYFDLFFNRDITHYEWWCDAVNYRPSVRSGSEVNGLSKLDVPIELLINTLLPQANYVNLSVASPLDAPTCDGFSVPINAHKIIRLAQTQCQTASSPVHAAFAEELTVNLNRIRELGLPYYAFYQGAGVLTGGSAMSSNLTGNLDIIHGIKAETHSGAYFAPALSVPTGSSVHKLSVAINVVINNIIAKDRTGLIAFDENNCIDAPNYYPLDICPDPDMEGCAQMYCYMDGGDCSANSWNAFVRLVGAHPNRWDPIDTNGRPRGLVRDRLEFYGELEGETNAYYDHHSILAAYFLTLSDDNSIPSWNSDLSVFMDNEINDCIPHYVSFKVSSDRKCCSATYGHLCRSSTYSGCNP